MINADLKLVIEIRDGIFAYHTPISREVYEANFRLLRDTKVAIWGTGAQGAFSARGDAPLYLKEAGRELALSKEREGDSGAGALLAEIKRLTMVLAPQASGWDMLPVEAAVTQGAITSDDWEDVEASLVFFTCARSGVPKKEKETMDAWAASLLGGLTTSLPPMEWIASLPTSTKAETIEKKAESSVPS